MQTTALGALDKPALDTRRLTSSRNNRCRSRRGLRCRPSLGLHGLRRRRFLHSNRQTQLGKFARRSRNEQRIAGMNRLGHAGNQVEDLAATHKSRSVIGPLIGNHPCAPLKTNAGMLPGHGKVRSHRRKRVASKHGSVRETKLLTHNWIGKHKRRNRRSSCSIRHGLRRGLRHWRRRRLWRSNRSGLRNGHGGRLRRGSRSSLICLLGRGTPRPRSTAHR